MHSSFLPPRRVTIEDAAAFVGTTPRTVRHYHQLGLLPEPERGGDDDRRYGHDDVIRLLQIRAMADAGTPVDDIGDALADAARAGADGEVSRRGLLSDVVTGRLETLPEGSLRQADLDALLVSERIFGALGAAVQVTRFLALATHPDLREESDRVDAAEEALDDTVAVDDPRVAHVAAERHAFERVLDAVIEDSGLAAGDVAFVDAWEALHPATGEDAAGPGAGGGRAEMRLLDAVGVMPYDYSPARLRCMELVQELAAHEARAS